MADNSTTFDRLRKAMINSSQEPDGPFGAEFHFLCAEIDRLNSLVASLQSARPVSAPPRDPNEEEFRDGLPAKELRDAWVYWSTVERGSNAIADLQFMGDEYRFAWWSATMPNRTIDSFGLWDKESFRPNGKTWADVEAMAIPCKNCNGISPKTCAIKANHP